MKAIVSCSPERVPHVMHYSRTEFIALNIELLILYMIMHTCAISCYVSILEKTLSIPPTLISTIQPGQTTYICACTSVSMLTVCCIYVPVPHACLTFPCRNTWALKTQKPSDRQLVSAASPPPITHTTSHPSIHSLPPSLAVRGLKCLSQNSNAALKREKAK